MKLQKAQETNSKAIMPCPQNSSNPSKTTFVYRTEVVAPEGRLPGQHVLLIDCAGECIDSESSVLKSEKLQKWLDKK